MSGSGYEDLQEKSSQPKFPQFGTELSSKMTTLTPAERVLLKTTSGIWVSRGWNGLLVDLSPIDHLWGPLEGTVHLRDQHKHDG